MSALVIYDSAYGNTARIADAIRAGLGEDAAAFPIKDVDAAHLQGANLVVVGSPTQGGRPTAGMQAWLESIPPAQLRGILFAAFDTRLDFNAKGFGLRVLMSLVGYAAPRIAAGLSRKGAIQAALPEGFMVSDKEGPIADGELERARGWGSTLARATLRRAA